LSNPSNAHTNGDSAEASSSANLNGLASTPQKPSVRAARVDGPRIERAVRELLVALGEDPTRDGLLDTPGRVARSIAEMCSGLHENPSLHLQRQFDQECDGPVILRDIEFHSLCEHHLLPFFGNAHIAYLPSGGKVVGLSKLARAVDGFARRPQVQERLTLQVADAIEDQLAPLGVAVVIEGRHTCMQMRGVHQHSSVMTTISLRGVYRDSPDSRREILSLLKGGTHVG